MKIGGFSLPLKRWTRYGYNSVFFQGRYRKIPVIVLIALAELSIQLNYARNDWTG
jgi:hypothetical protein